MSAGHPTRRNSFKLKIAVILAKEQDGYFLFFKFRIATIRSPIVKSTINSSYVLIIPTTFRLGLGLGESTSPGSPGKHIIFSWCGKAQMGLSKLKVELVGTRHRWRMVLMFSSLALTPPPISGVGIP